MFLAEWTYTVGKYAGEDIRISKWLVVGILGALVMLATK
jgi:tetrahydromethanopterin S-methyltransferase subunit G